MLQRSDTTGDGRVEQSALWAVRRVAAECAVSTATIWRWVRAGRFPPPVHVGPGGHSLAGARAGGLDRIAVSARRHITPRLLAKCLVGVEVDAGSIIDRAHRVDPSVFFPKHVFDRSANGGGR